MVWVEVDDGPAVDDEPEAMEEKTDGDVGGRDARPGGVLDDR